MLEGEKSQNLHVQEDYEGGRDAETSVSFPSNDIEHQNTRVEDIEFY